MVKKFPRIPHLPWSPGGTNDDKRISHISNFIGNRIVITEKLDGSNLCLTNNEIFARSHSGSPTHRSFDLAKKMHSEIKHLIPENISVFGEWCFAVHSIEYVFPNKYPFFMFGFRMEDNNWWSTWEETEELSKKLNINTVPVLFCGTVENNLENLTTSLSTGSSTYGLKKEGIVIWPVDGMGDDEDFRDSTAKWVRADHPLNKEVHWMSKPITKQKFLER